MRKSVTLLVQVLIGLAVYFILRLLIKDDFTLLVVFVVLIFLLILLGTLFLGGSPTDALDVFVDKEKFKKEVEIVTNLDQKNLYTAYGYIHEGRYEKAKEWLNRIDKRRLPTSNHNTFIRAVIDLKMVYNRGNADSFARMLNEYDKDGVFDKVGLHPKTFMVHQHILYKEYAEAEELAKELIPEIRKRLYVIELEYLLALSYMKQNKKEDAEAIIDYIVKEDYPVVYTRLCKELLQAK